MFFNKNQSLIRAVNKKDEKKITKLLADGVSPNFDIWDRDYFRYSKLLHIAAGNGDLPIVKMLVEAGADVNACVIFDYGDDRKQESVLICAVRSGNQDLVEYLIQAGADVNYYPSTGNALYYAVGWGPTSQERGCLPVCRALCY